MENKRTLRETELSGRYTRLAKELEQRAGADEPPEPRGSRGSDYSKALRLSSEFVAAIVVGAALGWGLDRFAGTAPWGMIVLLLLGFVAGILNVVRAAGEMKSEAPADPEAGAPRNGGGSPA